MSSISTFNTNSFIPSGTEIIRGWSEDVGVRNTLSADNDVTWITGFTISSSSPSSTKITYWFADIVRIEMPSD